MKSKLRYSEYPFMSYSAYEIQEMIQDGIIPAGLAYFETEEEFESATNKVSGKLMKFALFGPNDQVQIFETYIDEFSPSTMGGRIDFKNHQYDRIGRPSDYAEFCYFRDVLKDHYLRDLIDSKIFISVLNSSRLGSGYLNLKYYLFFLEENFEHLEEYRKAKASRIENNSDKVKESENFKNQENSGQSEQSENSETQKDKQLVLIGKSLYRHIDYLDHTPFEVIALQNEQTGQIELHKIGVLTSAVYLDPELVQTIKNLPE